MAVVIMTSKAQHETAFYPITQTAQIVTLKLTAMEFAMKSGMLRNMVLME